MIKFVLVVLLLLLKFYDLGSMSHQEILQALRDEVKRSMDSLFIETLPKPYYIEVQLKVTNSYRAYAFLGNLVDTSQGRQAFVNVNVRVGDYSLDNTNFLDFSFPFFMRFSGEGSNRRQVPKDFDYFSLRRELWLAIDFAYKEATQKYSKKLAVIKNRLIKDTIPDFSKVEVNKFYDTNYKIVKIDFTKYCDLVKDLSRIIRNYPEIDNSSVSFEFLQDENYYVNSEGIEYIKYESFTGVEAAVTLQSNDGMPVTNFFSSYADVPSNLPSYDSLRSAVKQITLHSIALKEAKPLDDSYSGPIIFEGQAAGELFAQVFAPNLVAQRMLLSDQGFQNLSRFNAFQTKIGGRVLPEFLSLRSIPLKKDYNGIKLLGSYEIDDEGVPARNITLVEKGYLKTLLAGRTPIKRVSTSNGSNREGSAMFSNIEINSSKKYSQSNQKLREKALQLAKQRDLPFVIVVKKIMNQNIMSTVIQSIAPIDFKFFSRDQANIAVIEAVRLYPNGREEPIRGGELKGITPQSFKDIILVGNKPYVLNILVSTISSGIDGSRWIGASIICPDLLFEDVEFKPVESDFQKPSYLKNPLMLQN
ncbi:MAG: metallopeptidase TldD-related protein [Ignavibacteria bacterium]|nr:metallopeptidase TldD-related protein [Ignavibacteria bacterium]